MWFLLLAEEVGEGVDLKSKSEFLIDIHHGKMEAPPPSYEQAMASDPPVPSETDEIETIQPAGAYIRRNQRPLNLGNLFFISDQLADFYKDCGLDFPPSIKLVTEHRMASTAILVSLMTMYIYEKGLKNKERFFPDDRMKLFFQDTRNMLKGVEVPRKEIYEYLPETETRDDQLKFYDTSYGVFEILSEKMCKKSGNFHDPEKGALYFSIMLINSWYRIQSSEISAERKERLADPDRQMEQNHLTRYLNQKIRERTGH